MIASSLDAVRRRTHGLIRRVVVDLLSPRRDLLPPLIRDMARLRAQIEALAVDLGRERGELARVRDEFALWSMPFGPDMTVDQAWRRHPGAPRVFAGHHLPACDGCAVRFDETLGEAALAYDIDLAALMEDLQALLR